MIKPLLIPGGMHVDERGVLAFVNDFQMNDVQRFYLIRHFDTEVIRAWQGHRTEEKWFFPVSGSFLVAAVCPDDWDRPSPDLPVEQFVLNASNPQVLYLPAGLANGFRALTPDSALAVFSNRSLQESGLDDVRFPSHYWFNFNS